jgi:NADPH-dependent 2,4-dienoyl-CoA reductase/sulfur reductase-like enzyme
MSRRKRLVVIGGVAAGLSAASYAKRRHPYMEVTVFEMSPHASYGSCGLPYLIEGLVENPVELIALPLEDLRKKRGLDVRVLHEVTNIDTQERSVTVIDLVTGDEFKAPYDNLVISIGASPVVPPLPGIGIEEVFVLRTLEDGVRLEGFIKTNRPKRAVIIGGGYIGLEMAEAFSIRGCEVTLIEKMPAVLPGFDKEIAAVTEQKLAEKSIGLMLSTGVNAFEKTGTAISVITENGAVEADLVLLAAGIKPSTALAKKAGVELGATGAIKVNTRMETNVPGIYACGDCAESYHRILKRNVWIPLGDTANKEGRVAGANIVGEDVVFPGIIGTAATKVFDLEIARTGLGETEARTEGFEVSTALVDSYTRAHYYPGRKQIKIKVISEKGTKRLLGAQAVGGEGVAKRIDVFATAIWAGMTLDDVAWLDLSYVPPVATVWDPVLLAAQVASKAAAAR